MAKDNSTLLIIGVVVLVVMAMGGNNEPQTQPQPDNGGTNGGININYDSCDIVSSEAGMSAQEMFNSGTEITDEWYRVIKTNGIDQDKGNVSTDSGTLTTDPENTYLFLAGYGSSTYYGSPEQSYKAECKEAKDDVVKELCTIDTAPSVTTYDEEKDPQDGSSSNQTITADETVTMEVKVDVATDKCYGAPDSSRKNAICFRYNTTQYESVEAASGSKISVPYPIDNTYSLAGHFIECYELDTLKGTSDEDEVRFNVDVKATDTNIFQTTASSEDDIDVYLEDIAFDIDEEDLTLIEGFIDESRTNLGDGTNSDKLHLDASN